MVQKKYKNSIQLKEETVGNVRRYEMLSDILQNGTFLPKTVLYKDIDEAFKKFVENKLHIVSDEGKELPTMTLFSNQRFSEYTQSWKYTDDNKNLILNFKTISRENNPQYGNIQSRLWNIPGDRFYLAKRTIVLDDNGTESLLDLRMKQPMAIDLNYKVSIFCTKYQLLNDFNILVNSLFDARQCYIWPNEHPMPMTLEGVNDESSYQIDDRQFYAQTYNIKVMGYVITEDDYKVEEVPLKRKVNFGGEVGTLNRKADIEIDDDDTEISLHFPIGCTKASFTIDVDFDVESIRTENVSRKTIIKINDCDVVGEKFSMKENDEVTVSIGKIHKDEESFMFFSAKNINL